MLKLVNNQIICTNQVFLKTTNIYLISKTVSSVLNLGAKIIKAKVHCLLLSFSNLQHLKNSIKNNLDKESLPDQSILSKAL